MTVAQPPARNHPVHNIHAMAPLHASNPWEEHTRKSDVLSDAGSQEDEDEDAEFTYPGDYSTQFEELFDGEEDSESGEAEQRSDNDDEYFLYDGIDANTSISYKDQLREVLGQEDPEEEQVGSLAHENGIATHENDEPLVGIRLSKNLSSLIIVTDSNPQMWYFLWDPQVLPRRGYCRRILAYLHQIRNPTP